MRFATGGESPAVSSTFFFKIAFSSFRVCVFLPGFLFAFSGLPPLFRLFSFVVFRYEIVSFCLLVFLRRVRPVET